MPLVNRTFDQLIDFTRTSAATFVNSSGNIASTAQSRNLLTFTQEFSNAAWTKTNASAYPFDPATASLSANVVQNGDFSSGASWSLSATAPATATIASGKLTLVSPAGEAAVANQAALKVGSWYKVTGTVTVRSGTVKVICGGPTEFYFSATQTFTIYTQANSNTTLSLSRQTACDADFDDIVVQEVTVGISAPDGTFTADTMVATAGAGISPLLIQTGTTVTSSVYTASLFVRPGTHTFVQFYIGSQSADWCNFTLTGNGSVQNNGAAVGAISYNSATGWYRISMVYTAGGIDRRAGLAIVPSGTASRVQTGTYAGTETIFIWGAQLEQASSATDYTRNFGGLFPPRFDYDPVTLAPRGLLIEEQRTNLLLRSEEFDNASWTKIASSISANATTSPDGTADADKLVEDSANAGHYVFQVATTTAASHTFSVYAKASERSFILLYHDNGNSGAIFNLSNGAITTPSGIPLATATATAAGNGWYRCAITVTATAASNVFRIQLANTSTGYNYLGDGTSGVFLYGAQLEAGAFATSYIPTVAAQVTRTADVAAINAPNFASWYNQSEGTLLVEATTSGDILSSYSAAIVDAGITNIIGTDIDSGGAYRLRVTAAGVNQALVTVVNPIAANTTYKLAGAYRVNDFAASANGGAVVTDVSGTVPTGLSYLAIGSNSATGANSWNGHLRSIRFYPTRLTNAQLQALTA